MSETTILECSNCGALLGMVSGRFVKCKYCECVIEIKNNIDELSTLLVSAAAQLRKAEFEDAEESYKDILMRFPDSHEAYWGLLLSKNGIVFVDDLLENKKVPTCYKICTESLIDDENLHKAVSLAPTELSNNYRRMAEKIENIRIKWLSISENEPLYDVFICFKDSDPQNNIDRTYDSYEAQAIYSHLCDEGYRVFFSRETLRDKVSEFYEPYIFNALNTAKVMIVYGQKAEYIESTWLKNEWGRFVKKIAAGEKADNSLIVAYEKMNPTSLPLGLRNRQAMNASLKSFYHDLDRHIEKVINDFLPLSHLERKELGTRNFKKATRLSRHQIVRRGFNTVGGATIAPREETQVRFALSLLANGSFVEAQEIYQILIRNNPSLCEAYWGLFLCENSAINIESLLSSDKPITNFSNFERAISTAPNVELAQEMVSCVLGKAMAHPDAATLKVLLQWLDKENRQTLSLRYFEEAKECIVTKRNTVFARELFEASCLAIDERDVDLFIERNLEFADSLRKYGFFDFSIQYYDELLGVDESNLDAHLGKFLSSKKISDNKKFGEAIIKLVNLDELENILTYGFNEKIVNMTIDAVMTNLTNGSINAGKAIAFFEQMVSCVPKSHNDLFVLCLDKFSFLLIKMGYPAEAAKYIGQILITDNAYDRAYLARVLIDAKVLDFNGLLTVEKSLIKFPDFTNVINCSEKVLDKYMEYFKKQEFVLKNKLQAAVKMVIIDLEDLNFVDFSDLILSINEKLVAVNAHKVTVKNMELSRENNIKQMQKCQKDKNFKITKKVLDGKNSLAPKILIFAFLIFFLTMTFRFLTDSAIFWIISIAFSALAVFVGFPLILRIVDKRVEKGQVLRNVYSALDSDNAAITAKIKSEKEIIAANYNVIDKINSKYKK